MRTLTIKNTGRIRDAEIQLGKINVFTGARGGGKHMIMKIADFCMSVEHERLDNQQAMSRLVGLRKQLSYFDRDSYFRYNSDLVEITCCGSSLDVKWHGDHVPYVSRTVYIPTDRSIALLHTPLRGYLPDTHRRFMHDLIECTKQYPYEKRLMLPMAGMSLYYDDLPKRCFLELTDLNGTPVRLDMADVSSDIQSVASLMIVVDSMARDNTPITIEEPEHGVPFESQYRLLKWLMQRVANKDNSPLMFSTYSTPVLYGLNNLLLANIAREHMSEEQRSKLCYVTIDSSTVRIYETKDGKAVRIQDKDGLLHKNHLDTEMRYVMEDFYTALIHYK
jgi:predicted ATPase